MYARGEGILRLWLLLKHFLFLIFDDELQDVEHFIGFQVHICCSEDLSLQLAQLLKQLKSCALLEA